MNNEERGLAVRNATMVTSDIFGDSTYKGNDWVRIYIFELDDRSTDNDEAFKKLVEYKAIETRDSYYNLDFEYY